MNAASLRGGERDADRHLERLVTLAVQDRAGIVAFHAPGFIALKLKADPLVTINFWGDPTKPEGSGDTTVHNHHSAFTSTIVMGELTNVEYEAEAVEDGPLLKFLITKSKNALDQDQYRFTQAEGRYAVRETGRATFGPGDVYSMGLDPLHAGAFARPTITYMVHDPNVTTDTQALYIAAEEQPTFPDHPVVPGPKQPEAIEQAWAIIDQFVRLL
jgi:hypothetical protein